MQQKLIGRNHHRFQSHLVAALESLVRMLVDARSLARVVLLQLLQLCKVSLYR